MPETTSTLDLSAIAKWPNVPACYNWLSLDRRGCWRLQAERITHGGMIAFINRHYACDESGCWFVQNGPQRVFVSLACTPWVFRRESDTFISHTGQPVGVLREVYLDEEGSILLETELGIGLLDDRDLARFFAECRSDDEQEVDEDAFGALMETGKGNIHWHSMPLQKIAATTLAERFKFNPEPQPKEA
jgi:hypothetical protein